MHLLYIRWSLKLWLDKHARTHFDPNANWPKLSNYVDADINDTIFTGFPLVVVVVVFFTSLLLEMKFSLKIIYKRGLIMTQLRPIEFRMTFDSSTDGLMTCPHQPSQQQQPMSCLATYNIAESRSPMPIFFVTVMSLVIQSTRWGRKKVR